MRAFAEDIDVKERFMRENPVSAALLRQGLICMASVKVTHP
ncbi:MAG: hypothetical protein ACK4SS_04685 [Cypionkella sp.]